MNSSRQTATRTVHPAGGRAAFGCPIAPIRPILPILCLLATILCAPADAQHSRSDLLRMMRSANATERALARQLLPRDGIERLEDILPALADPIEAVWRTASNILTDIANEVSSPGREAERARFANELLARLAAKPGPDEAARLMNIVHLALTEGTDVGPITAYLDDPALRMNARDALQLAATTESKAALRAALPKAEGVFALALIDSLGLLKDDAAKEVLVSRLHDNDPKIRAAAARALAWTGDSGLVAPFQEVLSKAPKENYVESGDAFLLLTDAIATHGGQFDFAMDLYHWALSHLWDPALKGAAISGMGRHGDERVVPWILAVVPRSLHEPGSLDHAALDAFSALQGEVVSRSLFERHDELLTVFGPSIYAVYGRRGDERFLPLLIAAASGTDQSIERAATTTPSKSNFPAAIEGVAKYAAAGGDQYTRHVAMLALLDSNQPKAIQAVAKHAASLEGEARDAIVDALQLKAAEFGHRGAKDAAGAAYAGLYPLAATDKDKQFALAGMMRYPSEDAFALVKDLIGQDELAKLSVPFLAGIARALYDAKRPQDVERILDTLAPRIASPADMQAFLGSVRGAGPELARKLGFITQWHIIGPFAWSASDAFAQNHIGAPEVDLAATRPAPGGEARTWKAQSANGPNGIVDLTAMFGMATNAAAYAYAEIDVPEAASGTVRTGSDDGIKIWVNGEVVHEHNVDRGLLVDQDQAAVSLKAGKNAILVEITQGAGGWNFCLRLTAADGRPLAFTQ